MGVPMIHGNRAGSSRALMIRARTHAAGRRLSLITAAVGGALVVPLLPATTVAAVLQPGIVATARAPFTDAPLPYRFVVSGWTIRDVPAGQRPYQATKARSLVDTGLHDAHGVRKVVVAGRTYDHPVAQAQLALAMLDGYRVTKDRRYLTVALANAQRLIDTKVVDTSVVSDGAWFYPYRFSFSLHHYASFTMRPPWYSGMAQGLALSLFSRLAETTGASTWRVAADRTFASFLVPRRSTGPWVVELGSDGYVWLEEYASPTGSPAPDRTFNGHNFAVAGLYDFVALTQDARGARLLDGAMTSVLVRMPLLRNTAWISHYCLAHLERLDAGYHAVQQLQLLWFHQFTGDARFARWADLLMADYPTPTAAGRVALLAGRHTGYRFDASGHVVGSTSVTLARTSSAPLNLRMRIRGQSGYWYHITSGALAGTWLREQSAQYLVGTRRLETYKLVRSMVLLAGAHVSAVQVGGPVSAVLHDGILSFPVRTAFTFDARGVVNGVDRIRISTGQWRGWWVRASQVILDRQ